ncbi:hypothetical protein UPYG_G00279190 [Umbra pygmaea]|uniref:Pentraxin (PTX) domain-containing protein n=1 Tax=Umbra pygmaea TaxID=75934 RepID=A0ABD0WRM0_UMBPY
MPFYSYTPVSSVKGIRPWTSLCVTWERMTGVAQVWRGGSVSIRKRLIGQVVAGPPVLSMYSFEGQVTDVEVWDHVLSQTTIMDYMSGYVYNSGNLLTWSNAIYSTTGNVLLERNAYVSDNQPISGWHSPPLPMKRKCKWRKREMAKEWKLKWRNSKKSDQRKFKWLKTKREK